MENNSVIYILDENQNSREILKSYIEKLSLGMEIKLFNDYEYALQEIKSETVPPIIFIDITNINNKTNELIDAIKLLTSQIVITSVDYSTDMIIKAMRMGAREFLPKPIIKEHLKRVFAIFLQQTENNSSISKIITIYSNKGGIGKTTIATNLAYELARSTKDKVALVDLNLQLGDVSTFLNLNPTFDVAYFINNIVEKNSSSFLEAFERYRDTSLYVLSDPNYIEQAEALTVQKVENLLNALKKHFSYIVVDMSSNIDANSLKILDKSDYILFTTIVNIPAIRNTQRCLNLFASRRYAKDKVKIVINRYMENEEINIEDIESTLGEKIYWKIPNNYFSIMEAINKGVPIKEVNANSNISNNFSDFAMKISDDIVKETILRYRGF